MCVPPNEMKFHTHVSYMKERSGIKTHKLRESSHNTTHDGQTATATSSKSNSNNNNISHTYTTVFCTRLAKETE